MQLKSKFNKGTRFLLCVIDIFTKHACVIPLKDYCLGEKVKVEIVWSNYATKADLKNETAVNTSKVAKKYNLVSWKSELEKLGIHKLDKVATGLNSLKSTLDKLDLGKLETTPDITQVN